MTIDAKDIASLWSQENAIANQKTNYYVASMALLAWPTTSLWIGGRLHIAILLSLLGVVFSAVAFVSVARTVAYRDHWRRNLYSASREYEILFTGVVCRWYQKVSSSKLLLSTPLVGLAVWLAAALALFKAYLELPQ